MGLVGQEIGKKNNSKTKNTTTATTDLDKSAALVQWVKKMNLQNTLVGKMMDFEIGTSAIQFYVSLNAEAWRS